MFRPMGQGKPVNAMIVLATIAVALAYAGNGVMGLIEEIDVTLGELCAWKQGDERIILTPHTVKKLIAEHNRERNLPEGQRQCPSIYDESIKMLAPILEEKNLQDMCYSRMLMYVRNYHTKFIHFYQPELTKEALSEREALFKEPAIPAALREFFILFVKQIGVVCNQRLASQLKRAEAEFQWPLSSDFALVERLTAPEKPSRLLKFMRPKNSGQVSALEDLQHLNMDDPRLRGSEDMDDGAKLYVQVQSDDRLRRLATACHLDFSPIYEKFFEPVIELNNLGYTKHAKRDEEKRGGLDEVGKRWFDVIEICEVLGDIEFFQDPKEALPRKLNNDKDADVKTVKILSHDETSALRKLEYESRLVHDESSLYVGQDSVSYTPSSWGHMLNVAGQELKAFDADLKELVSRRTSKELARRNAIKAKLTDFFASHKGQLAKFDESSVMDKLIKFFDRHLLSDRGITLVARIIFAKKLN